MSQPVSTGNEFTWSGSLEVTEVRQVYERCQRLRLTGRLQLTDGDRSSEVIWLGGQPMELAGDQNTHELLLWRRGEFLVTQHMPDYQGALRDGVEIAGALVAGEVQRLTELCADHRLSADLQLQRTTGEAAEIRFTHGKVESALVGDQPAAAMQVLSVLSRWKDGLFRLRLRPLFGGETPAEAPIIVEKETGRGSFDVTGAIPIPSLWDDPKRAASRPPSAPRKPAAPSVEVDQGLAATVKTVHDSGEKTVGLGPREGATEPRRGEGQGSSRSGASPDSAGSPGSKDSKRSGGLAASARSRQGGEEGRQGRQSARQKTPKASPWIKAVLFGVLGGALAFVVVAGVRLGPRLLSKPDWRAVFSSSPSLSPAPHSPLSPASPDMAPGPAPAAHPGTPAKVPSPGPSAPSPSPSGELPAQQAPAPRPGELSAVRPDIPTDLPSPPAPSSAPVDPGHAPRERSHEVRAMVERAQRLIIEGRVRKAQEILAQAREQAPDDDKIPILEKQARGQLGHGELVLSGHGSFQINGHKFEAPRKMRVPAGPFMVNGKEVEVHDGEQHHLNAQPGG